VRALPRSPLPHAESARVRVLRHLALTALALVVVAHTANAALFDDEEARRRIADTNTRLAQVQRQLEDRIAALEAQIKSQGLVDLNVEIGSRRPGTYGMREQ